MRIERSIEIARAVEDVFAFVSEPANDMRWCPKVSSVEQTLGERPGPGAQWRVVHRPVPVLPARAMTYVLVDWAPPSSITWREDDGHHVFDVEYTLERAGRGTRFTQTDDIALGAPRIMYPIMRAGIGHDVASQLKRLKRHLEAR